MKALEKFMDQMGLTSSIEVDRDYHTTRLGAVCVRISVDRGQSNEYLQYHCYTMRPDGNVKYDEGNQIKGINQGVLAYLGMDREIDNYFDNKAREIAKNWLTKRYR